MPGCVESGQLTPLRIRRLPTARAAGPGARGSAVAVVPVVVILAAVVVVAAVVAGPTAMIIATVAAVIIEPGQRARAGRRGERGVIVTATAATGAAPAATVIIAATVVVTAAAVTVAADDGDLARSLVHIGHDPAVRGGQLDLPDRTIVQVIGLNLDHPAVRHRRPGQMTGLRTGHMRRGGHAG
jgi:hypothetical protein